MGLHDSMSTHFLFCVCVCVCVRTAKCLLCEREYWIRTSHHFKCWNVHREGALVLVQPTLDHSKNTLCFISQVKPLPSKLPVLRLLLPAWIGGENAVRKKLVLCLPISFESLYKFFVLSIYILLQNKTTKKKKKQYLIIKVHSLFFFVQ